MKHVLLTLALALPLPLMAQAYTEARDTTSHFRAQVEELPDVGCMGQLHAEDVLSAAWI